jgi:hypothetical protein
MGGRVLVVNLTIDADEAATLAQMRTMKRAREERRCDYVVCSIDGFNDDPRELWEVPDVRELCRRLVACGFISYLEFATLICAEAPPFVRQHWGATEVWLCSMGLLGRHTCLTAELLDEMQRVVCESNDKADSLLGPLVLDDLGIDFSAVEQPGYKEDAVREDIIAPLLRKAGYSASGTMRMERSKQLMHPFILIGSKKHRVNIVPDYTLYDGAAPLLILEAKAPGEPIIKSKHVEQAFSYAIHPEVRCSHYALCNGRQFAFYDTNGSGPIFTIDCRDIPGRWSEFEKYVLPRYLKKPELREFFADFGLTALRIGAAVGDELVFNGFLLQQIDKSEESLFVAHSTCNVGGLDCMVAFDFKKDQVDALLGRIPRPQATQIIMALGRRPFGICLDGKIRVFLKARLGAAIQGPHEQFAPMAVSQVLGVEYDPSQTLGPLDQAAVEAGVPILQA